MKTTLFFVFALVAMFCVIAEAQNAAAIQEEVAKHGLKCDHSQIAQYCNNPKGYLGLTKTVCSLILKAYLCDGKTSDDDLRQVLTNIVNGSNH